MKYLSFILSDAIRLLLVHNYGGWYSDVDIVFMRSLRNLRNVISGDHVTRDNTHTIGKALNNAIYHFDAGHEYIANCLRDFAAAFDPNERLSGGPLLMTDVLYETCGYPYGVNGRGTIDLDVFTPGRCQGRNSPNS
jgi:lactosylceramide 4-alpha-galactosyltransferase